MNGEVIRALAQYYANLNRTKSSLEHPELCNVHAIDTNGITKEVQEQEVTKKLNSQVNK
jgi:hypothetical protein